MEPKLEADDLHLEVVQRGEHSCLITRSSWSGSFNVNIMA